MFKMEEATFFVEFIVNDLVRFKSLQKIFDELKKSKDLNLFQEDSFYLKFFDEKAQTYFGWYSEKENQEWAVKWFATPVEKRWTEPGLQRKWEFSSMIDAFKNGEYELLSCEIISQDKASILFNPWAYLFGGTGCMKALIESFGFQITKTWELRG